MALASAWLAWFKKTCFNISSDLEFWIYEANSELGMLKYRKWNTNNEIPLKKSDWHKMTLESALHASSNVACIKIRFDLEFGSTWLVWSQAGQNIKNENLTKKLSEKNQIDITWHWHNHTTLTWHDSFKETCASLSFDLEFGSTRLIRSKIWEIQYQQWNRVKNLRYWHNMTLAYKDTTLAWHG